jgi:hypothetical protein
VHYSIAPVFAAQMFEFSGQIEEEEGILHII